MPGPLERLRHLLEQARDVGVEFDDAWPDAVSAALGTAHDAEEWSLALEATRGAWRDGFLRAGPPLKVAILAELDDGPGRRERVAVLG